LHRPTGRYRRSIKKQRKSRPSTSYVICCMFIFGCKRSIACTDKLGLGLRLVNLVWLGIRLVVAVTYRLPGTSPPIGERSTLMIMSVCLSVCLCLSVRHHISGSTGPIFAPIFCMLLIAVGRSSSGGVVMCHVFPAVRMTLFLHIVSRRKGQNEKGVCLK